MPDLGPRMLAVLDAALRAVDPVQAVRAAVQRDGEHLRIGQRSYDLAAIERLFVIGGGKAGAPMAAALAETLGGRITAGILNVKYGHTGGGSNWKVSVGPGGVSAGDAAPADTGSIELVEAGHPVPDAAGQSGAERMLALLTDVTERDLVIVLISGGGSALLPPPRFRHHPGRPAGPDGPVAAVRGEHHRN